jgi:hypothetical protein
MSLDAAHGIDSKKKDACSRNERGSKREAVLRKKRRGKRK